MIQRFHFQLKGIGLFAGENVLPVEVAVHQLDGGLITIHGMNKGRDCLEPCLLCCPEPPVAGDDLILRSGVLQRTDDQRR